MLNDLSSNDKVLLGIIVFILLAGVVESPSLIVLLLVLGAVFFRSSQNSNQQRNRAQVNVRQMRARDEDERPRRPANAEQIYAHALTAVRNARLNPDNLPVLPVDVGVISYHGNKAPMIHRTWPVRDDCDYIQPFVQLRLSDAAVGKIRFEIEDSQGQTIFSREDSYQLKRGRNLITPASRLPIHDEQEFGDRWALMIYADNMLIARDFFTWESAEVDFESPVGEDGEINSELRAVLKEVSLDDLSLDELLAYSEDEAESAQH